MVIRRVVAAVLIVSVFFAPAFAYATAATGTVTDRNVFTLTSAGAAKVLAAETKVAQAVRIMGSLGRLSGYVGVALVAVDIAQNTWDWWNQNYDAGLGTGSNVTDAVGSWGVNTTVGQPSNLSTGWAMFGPDYTTAATCSANMPGIGMVVVGEQVLKLSPQGCNGHTVTTKINYWFYNPSVLPTTSYAAAPGGTDRLTFTQALDHVVRDIQTAQSLESSSLSAQDGYNLNGVLDILRAARDYVSNGIPLVSTDYTHGSGWAAGSAAISGNAIPPPESGAAPTVDVSGVTSAVTAGTSAITSAIAAAQAAATAGENAVVSAIDAAKDVATAGYASVVGAVTAGTTAVVAAVQAVAAPIVAAISASQSAVVSAVNAVSTAVSYTDPLEE